MLSIQRLTTLIIVCRFFLLLCIRRFLELACGHLAGVGGPGGGGVILPSPSHVVNHVHILVDLDVGECLNMTVIGRENQ